MKGNTMTPASKATATSRQAGSEPAEFAHWRGPRRRDGVRVHFAADRWLIVAPDPTLRPTITACPCCDKPLWQERSAKLLADAVYPLQGNS